MPTPYTTWQCDKCRKPFGDYDKARACERGHIVDEAVAGIKRDLDRIMPGRKRA